MINNYFEDDDHYHPSDPVYLHPTHHHHLHIGDMSAAVDLDYLRKHNIRTGICLAMQW